MIRRLLVVLVAAIGLAWLLSRMLRRASAAAGFPSPATPRFEGAMVRDGVCRTFLPRSHALVLRDGDQEHFFCSEACRAAFLSRRRLAS